MRLTKSEEEDREDWVDARTGLPCLVFRDDLGFRGYVGVPPTHPLYGRDYDRVHVQVCGDLAMSSFCQEDKFVCHLLEACDRPGVWWFGFDTMHALSLSADEAYAKSEVTRLATQLATP